MVNEWMRKQGDDNVSVSGAGLRKLGSAIQRIGIFFRLLQKGIKSNEIRDIELARDEKWL